MTAFMLTVGFLFLMTFSLFIINYFISRAVELRITELEQEVGSLCDELDREPSAPSAPLAYVAGRYTATTKEGRDACISRAYDLAVELAAAGFVPVVPHPPESHADAFEAAQPYPFWIAGTLELMRRCDIVVCVDNWQESSGAKGEVAEQMRLVKPVFFSVADAIRWRDSLS